MATIIDGKLVSASIMENLKSRVQKLGNVTLAVVLVGDDAASKVYVKNKHLACEKIGINSEQLFLPASSSMEDVKSNIKVLAERSDIHGILIQLPLPAHLDEKTLLSEIPINKDVDAFLPHNVGAVSLGCHNMLPCTPGGIIELLDYYKIPIEGKNCVIVGRSNIVGKPLSLLMLERNATVTVCHSKTLNLSEFTKKADILISAVGKSKFITADMVKADSVVIDVGINRTADGKLCGDIDFENIAPLVSYITPVPGGVGPMTIATLMKNTVYAAELAYNAK